MSSNAEAAQCKCGQREVPAGCDGVRWYWQRHGRDACTLELPNKRCWCGLLRSEHIDGHREDAPRPDGTSTAMTCPFCDVPQCPGRGRRQDCVGICQRQPSAYDGDMHELRGPTPPTTQELKRQLDEMQAATRPPDGTAPERADRIEAGQVAVDRDHGVDYLPRERWGEVYAHFDEGFGRGSKADRHVCGLINEATRLLATRPPDGMPGEPDEADDFACHKCGTTVGGFVNDGDDSMGPNVCVDCYDPNYRAAPPTVPGEPRAKGALCWCGRVTTIRVPIPTPFCEEHARVHAPPTVPGEPDEERCHKCGNAKCSLVNDGDDAMGPSVCPDCYDPDYRAAPPTVPGEPALDPPDDYSIIREGDHGWTAWYKTKSLGYCSTRDDALSCCRTDAKMRAAPPTVPGEPRAKGALCWCGRVTTIRVPIPTPFCEEHARVHAPPTVPGEPACVCPFGRVVDGKIEAEERAIGYHVWHYLANSLARHLIAIVGIDVVKKAHGCGEGHERNAWIDEMGTERMTHVYRNTPWCLAAAPPTVPGGPPPGWKVDSLGAWAERIVSGESRGQDRRAWIIGGRFHIGSANVPVDVVRLMLGAAPPTVPGEPPPSVRRLVAEMRKVDGYDSGIASNDAKSAAGGRIARGAVLLEAVVRDSELFAAVCFRRAEHEHSCAPASPTAPVDAAIIENARILADSVDHEFERKIRDADPPRDGGAPVDEVAVRAILEERIAWHERESRACTTNISGLQGRGTSAGRAMNEGALKVHRIAVSDLKNVRAHLDAPTSAVSELRDCTCSDVRSGDSRCRGVGSLGEGWRCVKLGRGPTAEERAEAKRLLDEYAAKMTDHLSDEAPPTFIERCLRGEIENPIAAIDDAVHAWHTGEEPESMHVYLGMTWEEYGRWVIDPYALTAILEERRSSR